MRKLTNNARGVEGGDGRANQDIDRSQTEYKPGDYLVRCDTTGQIVLRSQTRINWRGVLQRISTFDPKHPQLEIRDRDEKIAVENPRPESDNDDDLIFGEGDPDKL